MVTETDRKIAGMAVSISDADRAKIMEAFDEILRRGWLMWGDWQERLQEQFKSMTGKDHAVTFNSCSSALEVLFDWLYVRGDSRVAFQANAFPSPAYMARKAGMELAWIDITPELLCSSLEQIDAAYEKSMFDVLVLQWTGGFISPEVFQIAKWCEDRRVVLIEDASHAAGSRMQDYAAGFFGEFSVFSLAATKPLQTGQGGMLLTDSQHVAQYAFQAKNYGRTEMFQKGQYVQEGGNLHMTELQAAVGSVLFESMPAAIEQRYQLAFKMWDEIQGHNMEALGANNPTARPNLYKLPVRLFAGHDKVALKEALAEQNIELGSSIYDFVTPHLEVFGGEYKDLEFLRTDLYVREHICLPLHNAMIEEDAVRVGKAVRDLLS